MLEQQGNDFQIDKNGDFVTINDWFYNQNFDPQFTIGMTLRDLEISKFKESDNQAKKWRMYVRT